MELSNKHRNKNNDKTKLCENPNPLKAKSIDEWDKEWIYIGNLNKADLKPYNKSVGLYYHKIEGKIIYLGRATELNNGGLRKRLSDYRRESDSARNYRAGILINQNLEDVITYILIVGNDDEAVNITKDLEGKFIERYKPEYNKDNNN